jgi:hypothetical protein
LGFSVSSTIIVRNKSVDYVRRASEDYISLNAGRIVRYWPNRIKAKFAWVDRFDCVFYPYGRDTLVQAKAEISHWKTLLSALSGIVIAPYIRAGRFGGMFFSVLGIYACSKFFLESKLKEYADYLMHEARSSFPVHYPPYHGKNFHGGGKVWVRR